MTKTISSLIFLIVSLSCGALLGQDLPRFAVATKAYVPEPINPTRNVVIVHGFLESPGAYNVIANYLRKRKVSCLAISLTPCDARTGLEDMANQMQNQINAKYGCNKKISIVAFSMGGLVSRYYLQNLGGAKRCDVLITMATPHRGTYVAHLYPDKGAAQMRPNSAFLTKLNATAHKLKQVRLYSFYTPFDLTIVPYKNSIFPGAVNYRTYAPIHQMVPATPSVFNLLDKVIIGKK